MNTSADVLIIGAGPFGLAMAAEARRLGIDYLVVGKPMEFWSANMPAGMRLRSACDWHLDPAGVDTIQAFLETQGLKPVDVEPLSRDFYLSYARWFQERKGIQTVPAYVQRLDRSSEGPARYRATLDDGRTIDARSVVVAVGFKYLHARAGGTRRLPAGGALRALVRRDRLHGAAGQALPDCRRAARRVRMGGPDARSGRGRGPLVASPRRTGLSGVGLVVGRPDGRGDGRGSRLVPPPPSRREGPRQPAPLGRRPARIEPWLEPRIKVPGIALWPQTHVSRCDEQADGALAVALNTGHTVTVDRVVLACGYKVEVHRVPFLAAGDVLRGLAVRDGYPELDERFQTSLPGLFITSMPAGQDFGPFFGFTISVRTSARLIGQALVR